MLGCKLNHVSKRGYRCFLNSPEAWVSAECTGYHSCCWWPGGSHVTPQSRNHCRISLPGRHHSTVWNFHYCQTSYIRGTLVGKITCWSLRCSWSIASRRCSNCIFIRDWTPGFNGFSIDNDKTRLQSFKFCNLAHLILEILWYIFELYLISHTMNYEISIECLLQEFW